MNAKAVEELLPLVFDELRRLAANTMANEAPGQTLQTTALDPRKAELVKRRYFVGMTFHESTSMVQRSPGSAGQTV